METIFPITFRSLSYQLSGSLCLAKKSLGGILFVAGGGNYTKELYREWQKDLVHHGYSSFAFDFPGIGESEGELFSTSLNTRLFDTTKVFDLLLHHTSLHSEQIFLY